MLKFSIIIPVYNVEKYLAQCLDSALNQTLSDIEIICVNDGSTDSSEAILQSYSLKDSRIFIFNQDNQGVSCARNKALEHARSEYILFLDSDDYLRKDACEILYKQAKKYSLDMLSFGCVTFCDETGKTVYRPYYEFEYLPPDFDTNVFNYKDCTSFMANMAVTPGLTIYKRSFINVHQLQFPPHLYFEDNLFFHQALTKASRCGILKERLCFKRMRSSGITSNWEKYFLDYLSVSQLIFDYLKTIDIGSKIYQSYKSSYCGLVVKKYKSFNRKWRKIYYQPVSDYISRYKPNLGYQILEPSFKNWLFNCYATKQKVCFTIFGFCFAFKNPFNHNTSSKKRTQS